MKSVEDVRLVVKKCEICSQLKPAIFKSNVGTLVQARRPFERISKGSSTYANCEIIFMAIDEYSQYPFAFACKDASSDCAIACINSIVSFFDAPDFIHSYKATSFMSYKFRKYFMEIGTSCSHSSPYHPIGNGQVERFSVIVWNAVRLTLKDKGMDLAEWETVLPEVLNSIRILTSTATGETPHDRVFQYQRKPMLKFSLPSWIKPGSVYVKKFNTTNKNDDKVEEATIKSINPYNALIRHKDGNEGVVSTKDLDRRPHNQSANEEMVNSNGSGKIDEPDTNIDIGQVNAESSDQTGAERNLDYKIQEGAKDDTRANNEESEHRFVRQGGRM
ncbi:hypothetical protein ACOME3_002995 [Neoechinorhynchus agilis]